MSDRSNKVMERYNQGYNRPQALFSVFAEELGMDLNTALKISSVFEGGVSHMGMTCSVISSSLMVLGLKYCLAKPNDEQTRKKVTEKINSFVNKFRIRNGMIECRNLLLCDINTKEGEKFKKDHRLDEFLCTKFLTDSVEIIEEIFAGK